MRVLVENRFLSRPREAYRISKFANGEKGESKVRSPTIRKFDLEVLEERFFAALSYVTFLCFVPLLLKKESRFAQFHAKQGLALFILEVAASILRAIPALGDTLGTLAFVVFSILSVVGIVKALIGESWQIPVIHDLASKMSFWNLFESAHFRKDFRRKMRENARFLIS